MFDRKAPGTFRGKEAMTYSSSDWTFDGSESELMNFIQRLPRTLTEVRNLVFPRSSDDLPAWESSMSQAESFSYSIDTVLADIQALNITIIDCSNIKEYLARNVDCLNTVWKLSQKAVAEFGTNSTLRLELFTISDEGGTDTYLRLLIRQWPYENDLYDRIQRIYENAGLNLMNQSGWLQITTDFCRP